MCTVLAGAVPDYSFVATDLGVSTWGDGQLLERSDSVDRLQETGAGWAAGTGDGRLIFRVLDALSTEDERVTVSTVLDRHAELRRQEPHEPDQLESTAIITASPGQFGHFVVGEDPVLKGVGEFMLRTPPAVSGDEKRELVRDFSDRLDPTDAEGTLPDAAGHVIGTVARQCEVTSRKFSIGGVAKTDSGWKRRRCDSEVLE